MFGGSGDCRSVLVFVHRQNIWDTWGNLLGDKFRYRLIVQRWSAGSASAFLQGLLLDFVPFVQHVLGSTKYMSAGVKFSSDSL